MSIAAPEPKANMGQPIPRYDAVAKVTGKAQYGADVALVNPVYAFLVTSSIAKGRIDGFDLSAAKQVRGVVDIVTHENAEKLKEAKLFSNGGYTSSTIQPLKSADIAQEGQIVAVVLAETFEAARQAAYAVKVNYTAAIPTTTFDSPGTTSAPAKGQLSQFKEDPKVGDFAKAFDAAEVKITAEYETPPQHHNPMELFATSCVWNGDSLTIYEPTQYVHGLKNGVAEQLDIDADKVRVINSYVGGAFGSKGSMTPRTAIIACDRPATRPARQTGRHPRPGFHHCHVPRRNPPPDQARRHPRRQADLAPARRLGDLVPPRSLCRRRHQDHDADVRLPQRRQPGFHRAGRPQYARLHAGPARGAVHVCAGKRDGRTRLMN